MLSLLFFHFSLFKLGALFKLKEARETFVRDLNIFLPILAHAIRKKHLLGVMARPRALGD